MRCSVTRDGTEVPYKGPQVKRGMPEHADYVKISAGKSARAVVNLADAYEVGRPGTYAVAFTGHLQDVTTGATKGERRPLSLECSTARFDVAPP